MDFSSLGDGFSHKFLQHVERIALLDSHLCGQFFYTGLRTHPDDVVHVDVVAKEIIFVIIYVDDAGITWV